MYKPGADFITLVYVQIYMADVTRYTLFMQFTESIEESKLKLGSLGSGFVAFG
jgi:hypothetical protein